MANINLVTTNRIRVVKSWEQFTVPRSEAITAGSVARQNTTDGKLSNSNATTNAEARLLGIATQGIDPTTTTVIRSGILDGYDLSGLDYDAPVYLSDTDGRLADAPGTIPVKIGRVIAGTATTLGTAYDKMLLVEIEPGLTAGEEAAVTRVLVTSELLAASVDKWIFVADRAYRVALVEEIHSVVGGSGAVVSPRKVTAAGTAAPGAAAGATVKELTAAVIDLTATVNVTQTPALSATPADLLLADGDKIGLDFAGTLTGLVGVLVITLTPV